MAMIGSTALVTGASGGIGAAIAHRLASEGVRLVLVARSKDALDALASTIHARHGVRPTVIVLDLERRACGALLLQQVQAAGIEVDLLVNNAGFGTYGAFETLAPELEQAQIAVNIGAVVDLTHAFLPGMLARGRVAILNIASTAAFQPCPFMAVYAATKAFVLSFSEALWAEYRGRGVHVAALCPGAVDTGFIGKLGDPGVRETAVFSSTLSPQVVAEQAIRALRGGGPTHIVGLKNALLANSARVTPRRLMALISGAMLRPRTHAQRA
ncbi:MAG: SDR family oxidoreductase [Burkholderiales bacterium]|nr:MAG: SDR family oxidoreductase [Burkholderiales bacterium]